ncbi:MAG: spore photoproduct lyase [Eubacteriales bacterium]
MLRGSFPFVPKRAFFEKEALEYSIGLRVFGILKELGTEVRLTGSHNRITGIPGAAAREAYLEGKRTLVVGVRKTLDFQTCKPSAHFQLPLVTGCPGKCQYCYLNTTLGKKPYIRVYVNIDDILGQARKYIDLRLPEPTVFEGAATSDPLPVEPYTGALSKAVTFFGEQEHGRFRFVTKFTNVEPLLNLQHQGHTRIRFSINASSVIDRFERGTPGLAQRLDAAEKAAAAGYPTGFIIAPVFWYPGWQEEYRQVFHLLRERFGSGEKVTLEMITHRFTKKAKNIILDVFPDTTLPMDETERKFKFGQFGYGKYVYQPDTMDEIKSSLNEMVQEYVPMAKVEYLV